jgi:hypothetical protein
MVCEALDCERTDDLHHVWFDREAIVLCRAHRLDVLFHEVPLKGGRATGDLNRYDSQGRRVFLSSFDYPPPPYLEGCGCAQCDRTEKLLAGRLRLAYGRADVEGKG